MDARQELLVLRNQLAIMDMLNQMALEMNIGGGKARWDLLLCSRVDTRARIEMLERKGQQERERVRNRLGVSS